MSKEAIIDKILSDANLKGDAIIGEANEKANEIISLAANQCKDYLYKSKTEIDRLTLEIDERSRSVAELDARKLLLAAKAQVLDSVYAKTLEKLRNLDKEQYSALIFSMLENAKDGDVVTVSEREKDIVTKESLADFAKKKGISLTLADKFGDFDGGVIISENGVDNNFTLEVEVALLREQTETKIAKEIFG
jgi:V/A-type H+-transporting ATPase subunit E